MRLDELGIFLFFGNVITAYNVTDYFIEDSPSGRRAMSYIKLSVVEEDVKIRTQVRRKKSAGIIQDTKLTFLSHFYSLRKYKSLEKR